MELTPKIIGGQVTIRFFNVVIDYQVVINYLSLVKNSRVVIYQRIGSLWVTKKFDLNMHYPLKIAMKKNKFNIINSFIRTLIGVIFLLSAMGKFAEFIEFTLFIKRLVPFSDALSLFTSSFIISIELLIGSFLLFNINSKKVCVVTMGVILFIFIPFTLYSILGSNVYECRCFGVIEVLNTGNHYFNLLKNALILSAVTFVYLHQVPKKEDNNYKNLFFCLLLFIIPIFSYNYFQFDNGLNFISFVEVEQYLERSDEFILVDARDQSIYQKDHIPGAISIPYMSNATDLSKLENVLSSHNNKKILTYCDSSSCNISGLLALQISKKFNIPVFELRGGIEKWKNHI